MNAIKRWACWLAVAALCASGCGHKDEITVLSDGYETAARTQRSFMNEPESLKVKLYNRSPNGKRVLVWPILHSEVFIKDGVAVFAGSRSTGRSKLDNILEMKLRLFVVKAPEPPIDVTSVVIGGWARKSAKDIATVVRTASLLGAQGSTNEITCHFEFDDP